MAELVPWWQGLQKPGQTFGPDFGQMISAQQMQEKLKLSQQTQQGYNALGALYANPANVDEKGNLRAEALQQLMSVAPMIGLDVQGQQVQNVQRQAATANAAVKARDANREWLIGSVAEPAVAEYDRVLKETGSTEAAQRAGQTVYSDAMTTAKQDGRLSPEETRSLSPQFDPNRARTNVLGLKGIQAQQKEARTEARQDAKFSIETDEGRSPPVQYRLYPDGRMTDLSGAGAYTPTGVGATKGAEAKLFSGRDAEGNEVTVRMGPTGGWLNAETGTAVKGLTGIHTVGTEKREFSASKPVVVLDKDGKAVATYAGREATQGVGFIRGDTGDPIEPPPGGKVVLGTDKDAPEEAKRATASQIANYDLPPPGAYAMRTKSGIELMAMIKEENPSYSAPKYFAAKTLREGYSRTTTNSPGQRIGSINTAVQHFEALQGLSDALQNKDIPAANAVINYVRQNLGRENVTDFNIAAQIVADEALKAVIGSGAVFDREQLQKQLTNTRSPDQIKGGLKTLTNLMAGQAKTLRKQWTSTGLPEDEWAAKLVPDAAELLAPYLEDKPKDRSEARPAAGTKQDPATAAVPPRAAAAPQGGPTIEPPPAEAMSALKEGQVTTFRNGQSWTLRNGKPEKVN